MGKKDKSTKVVRRAKPRPSYKGKVRSFHINSGLPTPAAILQELSDMRDVLQGREDPPLEMGILTLMETAEGYFSRACALEQEIYTAVRQGKLVGKTKTEYSSIRTQELRSFKEMAKSAAELGSRRLTFENLRFQQEMRGLESL